MRYTFVDEAEAPPRPNLRHGGKRHQELDTLIASLAPGTVARLEQSADEAGRLRNQLYQAAARLGRPIEVWEGPDGTVYAGVVEERDVPSP